MFVEDEAVEVDVFEGDVVGGVETEHDHAADPLEEDVVAGFHDRGGVEARRRVSEVVGDDEGPLAAAEPGVESVFVASVGGAIDFDLRLVGADIEDPVPCPVVEGGDGDAPRDLAGDVPVFEFFEVVDEDLFFAGGVKLDLPCPEGFDGAVGEGFGADEPLLFEKGLNDSVAFVTAADGVGDGFFASEEV